MKDERTVEKASQGRGRVSTGMGTQKDRGTPEDSVIRLGAREELSWKT